MGGFVAEALAGGWREEPPRLLLAIDDLELAAPLLLAVGTGAIAWRRMRGTELEAAPAAAALRHAYRVSALQATLHERAIVDAFARLRAAGVEPLLFKGWLASQLYPEPGLRPYGDIDLCVHPGEGRIAEDALASLGAYVDLHEGLSERDGHGSALEREPLERLFARSRLMPLNGTEIRVLAPEDHLALLCLHLANHGAHRPLHLCDVAAAVEALPDGFDWDTCMARGRRRAAWIAWSVQLAQRVLDARIAAVPAGITQRRMPGWLDAAVLRRWGTPTSVWWPPGRQRAPYLASLPSVRAAADGLRARWPDPIHSAFRFAPPVWWVPPLPSQLIALGIDVSKFVGRLPRQTATAAPKVARS